MLLEATELYRAAQRRVQHQGPKSGGGAHHPKYIQIYIPFWWILVNSHGNHLEIMEIWSHFFRKFTKIIHQDMGELRRSRPWKVRWKCRHWSATTCETCRQGGQTPETWRALLQVMTCYDWVVQIGSQYLNVMNYIMDSSEHCKKWGDTNSYFTPLDWLLNPSEHTKDPSSWSRGPSRTASPFRTDPDLIFLRLLSAQNSSKTLPRGQQALHGTAVAVVYSS